MAAVVAILGIVVRPMSHKKIIRCESDKGEYIDARVGVEYLLFIFAFLSVVSERQWPLVVSVHRRCPGGGGVLKKVLYGEAPPRGPTPYPFKRYPFRIPFIGKRRPFHIPS